MGNQSVKDIVVNDINYTVVGCWDEETPAGNPEAGKFDYYDVFNSVTGVCINEGHPYYETIPTAEDIRTLVGEE